VCGDGLRQRAAGVVADKRRVVELELLDQLGDQPREPGAYSIVPCITLRNREPLSWISDIAPTSAIALRTGCTHHHIQTV
jgi:hypothetical protein